MGEVIVELKPVFIPEDFAPGRIFCNNLELDPSRPPAEQAKSAYLVEDLIRVDFSENVVVDVGWLPDMNPQGSFIVVVNENPYMWSPSFERRCRTVTELREIVREAVALGKAKSQSPLWKRAFSTEDFTPGDVRINGLWTDGQSPLLKMLSPLEAQTFIEVEFPGKATLTVDWQTAPFDPLQGKVNDEGDVVIVQVLGNEQVIFSQQCYDWSHLRGDLARAKAEANFRS